MADRARMPCLRLIVYCLDTPRHRTRFDPPPQMFHLVLRLDARIGQLLGDLAHLGDTANTCFFSTDNGGYGNRGSKPKGKATSPCYASSTRRTPRDLSNREPAGHPALRNQSSQPGGIHRDGALRCLREPHRPTFAPVCSTLNSKTLKKPLRFATAGARSQHLLLTTVRHNKLQSPGLHSAQGFKTFYIEDRSSIGCVGGSCGGLSEPRWIYPSIVSQN
jgi:hypothetical protein